MTNPQWSYDGITLDSSVRHSVIQHGSTGPGNFDVDPLFTDPATGDWSLSLCSPCRDAGDAGVPGLPAVDIAGNPRISLFGIDIGAYEITVAALADCDGNQTPDACDIASGYADADLDGVPDACLSDCNGNGTPDGAEVASGASPDCDGNGLPDSCDLSVPAHDADGNGILDACEITHRVPLDFPTIQAAIDAADSGEIVLVAPGIYDVHLDFHGKDLRLISERGPVETVLRGLGPPSPTEDDTPILQLRNGESSAALVRGFTIRLGRGREFSGPNDVVGGGIFCTYASPTIEGNVFEQCTAQSASAIFVLGGSPAIRGNVFFANGLSAVGVTESTVELEDCTFVANEKGIVATSCDLVLRNCVFRDSSSGSGSVVQAFGSNVVVEMCRFERIEFDSSTNPSILDLSASTLVIERSTFVDCDAQAIELASTVATVRETRIERVLSSAITTSAGSDVDIQGCEFIDGVAPAVDCIGGSLAITESVFTGNGSATEDGAAVYLSGTAATISATRFADNFARLGGALRVSNPSGPEIQLRNCLFDGNRATQNGGAIYCTSGSIRLEHCTLAENTAQQRGGAVYFLFAGLHVVDSILWGNAAQGDPEIFTSVATSVSVENSIIAGGSYGALDADPIFVSGPGGEHLLSQTAAGQALQSPAVDAGSASAVALGLSGRTTRIDEFGDTGVADLGYHAAFADCDGNVNPDASDPDADGDGVPDACDLCPGAPDGIDCDADGIPDACRIAAEPSLDCDGDGVIDPCTLAADPSLDCNWNGVLDGCDITSGTSLDLDSDGKPDECTDCDGNGVSDLAQLLDGSDCNGNGVFDACDIAGGSSLDGNADGIPDDCQDNVYVPGGHPSIQAAIDAATPGRIINVQPGVYVENITFAGKAIIVRSIGGPGVTIIDGGAATAGPVARSVVRFMSGEGPGSVLEGFTLRNGSGYDTGSNTRRGGGIYLVDAEPMVRNCWITSNAAAHGGGVYLTGFRKTPRFERNRIVGNVSTSNGGGTGVRCENGITAEFRGNLIAQNSGGPSAIGGGSQNAPRFLNNTIAANGGAGIFFDGGLSFGYNELAVGNILWGNAAASVFTSSGNLLDTATDPDAVDPLFVDAPGGDYAIMECSPAIDRAYGVPIGEPIVDLTGAPRIGLPDAGAFEYLGGLSGPDCDGNGVSDSCQLVDPEQDCDGNGVLDSCDIASGAASDCDVDGHPDACDPDCDGDGDSDRCQILSGTLTDCDLDGIPDSCEIAAGAADCDANGIVDACERFADPSADCDSNLVLDVCQIDTGAADCDGDGVLDSCQEVDGTAGDCDADSILDSCEIAAGAADCDADGVPDDCQLAAGLARDCDGNGVPDPCDIAQGAPDCDGDGIPDSCAPDCDLDGIPDDCELLAGGADCDGDGQLDQCQLLAGAAADCDGDGVLDQCRLASSPGLDCNCNGIPDPCDIVAGTSVDGDLDGTPDECVPDCDGDGLADACEIATGIATDCDADGVPDACQIAQGAASDANGNGIIDGCEEFRRGDANSDGALDISDPVSVISHLFLAEPIPCVAALDGNDDGGVDLADAIYLFGTLFTQLPPPPPPFPDCGIDPSPSSTLECEVSLGCP